MRWFFLAAIPVAAALFVVGCTGPDPGPDNGTDKPVGVESGANGDACDEPYEFAYFQYARKGDYGGSGRKAQTIYTLLYTSGWMKTNTFGGPFEKLARTERIQTNWKEIRKQATHDLYAYMYEKGFFDLPGSDLVEWGRFKPKGYNTKAISVTRDDVRHIVFMEDVTGQQGDDPRWNIFNDCVRQLTETFSAIEDVRAHVQKGGFDSALEDYLKGK